MGEINTILERLLTIATGVGLLACAFFLCLAGFYFMTSGGNPSAIERAKSAAYNAALGFGIVLSARIIARLVQGIVPS